MSIVHYPKSDSQEEIMEKVTENWDNILQQIKSDLNLTNVSFNTWLKPLKVYSVEDNVVTLVGPENSVGMTIINRRYKDALQIAIREIADLPDCEVNIIQPQNTEKPAVPAVKSPQKSRSEEAHLIPKYTFDTFVVGSNNRLAQAASLAVAEAAPGTVYNPLFIYGGPGLGKTHLMHSIGHFSLDHDENVKVLYVTSEDFTNEVINNIRNGNDMEKFREKYRSVDILLVDDIQFIIGKDATQQEFFHTFNTLYDAGKQIIISSDKSPNDLSILEERLRSRFQMGLTVDISLPDYETRVAILHMKEEKDGYKMNEDIIQYIAENVNSNIRELEGAFNKVVAYSKLEQKEISIDLAKECLSDVISPNHTKILTPEYIISAVAEQYVVSVNDIIGNKRNAKVVMPRQISMYLIRELTDTSLKSIGKYLGNRDHSTIKHGIEKVEKDIETNDNVRKAVESLKKKINPPS